MHHAPNRVTGSALPVSVQDIFSTRSGCVVKVTAFVSPPRALYFLSFVSM